MARSHAPRSAIRKQQKDAFDGMTWIPGGEFVMGSNDFYPEERPVHRVRVDGFWMDTHPVDRRRVSPIRARHRVCDGG